MVLTLPGLKKKKYSAPTECWPLKYNNKYTLTKASGQTSPGKIIPVASGSPPRT